MKKKKIQKNIPFLLIVLSMTVCFTGCNNSKKEESIINSWNLEDYEQLEEIINIEEIDEDNSTEVITYNVRYKSDDCEVVSYLSIPKQCLDEEEKYPCIIFNRGGNREYGANTPLDIAYLAETSQKIVFASQYRGVSGGTGLDEFGGEDIHDVLKLIVQFLSFIVRRMKE